MKKIVLYTTVPLFTLPLYCMETIQKLEQPLAEITNMPHSILTKQEKREQLRSFDEQLQVASDQAASIGYGSGLQRPAFIQDIIGLKKEYHELKEAAKLDSKLYKKLAEIRHDIDLLITQALNNVLAESQRIDSVFKQWHGKTGGNLPEKILLPLLHSSATASQVYGLLSELVAEEEKNELNQEVTKSHRKKLEEIGPSLQKLQQSLS